MKENKIQYLVGEPIEMVLPLEPFNKTVCSFFANLSKKLQKDKEALAYPDVLSFAFYCRKGNIEKIKETLNIKEKRIGRGLVFHVTPSNVPVNFAFSYLFGMLSGNANVVRVSTKDFPQIRIICRVINELFADDAFSEIRKRTAIIRYERNKEINDYFSERCAIRIIWGGDSTIKQIRMSPIGSRCKEITFADRFSFALFDVEKMKNESEENINKLANGFYNDSYLMDQNACSTPHLILWKSNGNYEDEVYAKTRFWKAVFDKAQKYDLADIKVSDKYVALCKAGIENDSKLSVERYENLLYVLSISELPEEIEKLRGKFGMFYQYSINDLKEIVPYITDKFQTCVYYGEDPIKIADWVINNNLLGIDRVVPIGKSLDIGVVWDGYDLIREMSRIVNY